MNSLISEAFIFVIHKLNQNKLYDVIKNGAKVLTMKDIYLIKNKFNFGFSRTDGKRFKICIKTI